MYTKRLKEPKKVNKPKKKTRKVKEGTRKSARQIKQASNIKLFN